LNLEEKDDDKTTLKAFIDFAIKCHIRQTLVFSHLIFRLIAFRKFLRFQRNLVFLLSLFAAWRRWTSQGESVEVLDENLKEPWRQKRQWEAFEDDDSREGE
jgi:hypothetical protein